MTAEIVIFIGLLIAAPLLRYYLVVAPKRRADFQRRWNEINGEKPAAPVGGASSNWKEYVDGVKQAAKDIGKN